MEAYLLPTPVHTVPRHDRVCNLYFITHTQAEARQLASAISRAGIKKGDVVSVMVPNVPLGVTCHFAVPGMGATLHMINTRLDAKTVAFQVL